MKNHSSRTLKVGKIRLFILSLLKEAMRISWWLFVGFPGEPLRLFWWSSWNRLLENSMLLPWESLIKFLFIKIRIQPTHLFELSKLQGGLWLTSCKHPDLEIFIKKKHRKNARNWKQLLVQACSFFASPHWGALFTSSQNIDHSVFSLITSV